MALVKRGTKGSPISASEYDAVIDQVETNQESVEVIQGQFVDSEVTLSFADLAAATAYWNLMDAASLTPSNNVEIYLQDVNQFWKWDSGETAKAVLSRANIEPKNTFNGTDEVNPSTMKATADYLASETEATPTAGSTKPVQSGGTYDELLKTTKKEFSEYNFLENVSKGYATGTPEIGEVFAGSTFDISSFNSGVIDCVEGEVIYLKVIGATSTRAWCFVNSSDEIISRADALLDLYNTPLFLTVPANAVKCYVNHKTSTYPNGFAMKLNEFSNTLKDTNNNLATTTDKVDSIETSNKSIKLYDDYFARFNGTTSNIILNNEYSLSVDGDYFEVVSKWNGSSSADGLGLIGKGDANTNNIFGYYNDEQIWFKDESSEYLKVINLTDLDKFHKLKLVVINSNTQYEVFKDDVSVGTFAKADDFKVKQLGNAYTTGAKVDVKSLKIHTSTDDLDIPNIFISEGTNTDLEILKDETADELRTKENNYPECLLSYNPTGSLIGTQQFIAFVKNQGVDKSIYFGFEISRDFDDDEIIYTNQYRLQRCKIYTYNGTSMTDTGDTIIKSGENEFTYKNDGKDDFSGGWHGDENLTEVNFYVDKIRLTSTELSSAFELRECSEFLYIQKSEITETAVGGVANPLHPVEALHDKYTLFSNSGYENRNRVVWQKSISDVYAHLTLCTLDNITAEFAQTNKYDIATLERNATRKIEGVNDNAHLWNETTGISVDIKSEFDVFNDSCNQYISDASNNNKYYRRTNNVAVSNAEEWNSNTIIKFTKN